MTSTVIYNVLLDSLTLEDPINITPVATPCRYRLLNCIQFTQHKTLHIAEFTDLPPIPYSAISYVWRGNRVKDRRRTFIVAGAENADPISIDVLEHACTASVQRGAEYLWLDRLCIMQTNRDDKAWQISRMYRIYQSCVPCIVLPGGLGRLVYLHEETAWIHRAWTLQEVLAPENAIVLFAWKLGSGECMCGDEYGTVHEVVQHQSAVSQVASIVNACVVGEMSFTLPSGNIMAVPTRIFGAESPNLTALGVTISQALSSDPDAKYHAIWQCALMRTSSRPVDMVFSIMGLFGVTIDNVREFDEEDRIGATIALAKKILESGGSANWLGASFRLPPCRQLSTFPEFPQTSVSGKALVRVEGGFQEAAKMVDGEYPNSLGLGMSMPRGRMDGNGYLTFSARAAQIIPMIRDQTQVDGTEQIRMTAVDGTAWQIYESPESAGHPSYPNAFVVLLGWFQKYYPGASLANDVKIRAMLIKEHAPQKFHLESFFSLDRQLKNSVMAWEEHTFSVGGPDALTLGTSPEHVDQSGHKGKDGAKRVEAEPTNDDDLDEPSHYGSMRYAQYFYLTEEHA